MKKLPQLTLRDLFWLVALVAMGCGWWVDKEVQAQRHEREVEEVVKEIVESFNRPGNRPRLQGPLKLKNATNE
jgi:hypothetical protein